MLRRQLRHIALDLLGTFAKPAKGIHILNGHMINRQNSNIETFLSQLNSLSKFSTFIKIEEAIDLIIHRETVNDPLLAFTFDDGFAECASMIGPALQQFNTNALFFINPNFVDGDLEYIKNFTENIVLTPGKMPMRWEDIRKLQKDGHVIGAHTMDHYMINSDNLNEVKHQIVDCKTVIENKLNTPCDYFAFPFGRMEHANNKSIEIALEHYKFVFSQTDYKNYFSYNGKVINRRHFEPFWPVNHVKYFISDIKCY